MPANFSYNNQQNNSNNDPIDDAFIDDGLDLDNVFTSYDKNGNMQLVNYSENQQEENTTQNQNVTQNQNQTPNFNLSQAPEYQALVQQNQTLQNQLVQVLQYVKGNNQQQISPENIIPLSERLQQPDGEQYLGNLIGKFVEQAMSPVMQKIQPTMQNIQFTQQAQQQYNQLKNQYPDLEDVIYAGGDDARNMMNKYGVEATYLILQPRINNNNRNRQLNNNDRNNLINMANRRQVENGSNQYTEQRNSEPKTIRDAIKLAMQQTNYRS